jgi:hypothetical protein
MSYLPQEHEKGNVNYLIWFWWGEYKVETTNNVIAFTGKYETSSNTINEDLIDEELAEPYRMLVTKWEEACILVDKHKKT